MMQIPTLLDVFTIICVYSFEADNCVHLDVLFERWNPFIHVCFPFFYYKLFQNERWNQLIILGLYSPTDKDQECLIIAISLVSVSLSVPSVD